MTKNFNYSPEITANLIKMISLAEIVRNYYNAIIIQKSIEETAFIEDRIKNSKEEKEKKYLRKILSNRLNQNLKDSKEKEKFFKAFIDKFTHFDENSFEIVDSSIDSIVSLIDSIIIIKENKVIINNFVIEQPDAVESDKQP